MKQLKILKDETNRNKRDSYLPKNQSTLTSFKPLNELKTRSNINRFNDISKNIINKANDLINKHDKILDLSKSYEQLEESIIIEPDVNKRKAKDTFITEIDFERKAKIEEKPILFEKLEETGSSKENNYIKNDFSNFKNMLNEIENAKKQIQSEYDDLNYLIKYVKDTKTSVKRHISGVKSIINKTGANKYLKPVIKLDNSFEGKAKKEHKVFDKNKQISKITNNLFGITNNVIGFHKTLSQNMNEIETRNKLNNKINRYNIL